MLPPPVGNELRLVRLERRVRVAQHHLQQVPQAVLDMVRVPRAVRRKADAKDVQAMELVDHRDEERALHVRIAGAQGMGVRRTEVGEAV